MSRVVQVAVGVIQNARGEVLIARRPEGVHQGGLWEFPGGKVDPGETLDEALARELWEELAIKMGDSEPLIEIHHDYPDKSVWLQVRRVVCFSGEPRGNEGQPVRWAAPEELPYYDFPAANRPIVNALRLPDEILVTGPATSDEDWLTRLQSALKQKVSMVQCRWPEASPEAYSKRILAALPLCRVRQIPLLANGSPEHWRPELDGLHLNSRQLFNCTTRPIPRDRWLGASCHNEAELERAEQLGVDYVTLSPVAPTLSHPGAEIMGWEEFERLAAIARVPVYAQGGLCRADKPRVKQAGGQGIAGIGFAWRR